MSTDPDDLSGSQGDQGTGAQGTSTPQAATADLEEKNAKLREENRQLHAQSLGATHGLTPTQIELLGSVSKDKQEDYAKRLGDETRATATAVSASDGSPAVPAVPVEQEPSDAATLAALATGGEAAAGTAAPADWQTQMNADIEQAAKTGDFAAIQRIQESAKRRAREQDRA